MVLTGAGVSAESGLKTFRDSDGLWEGYRVEDVATPEAWRRNPDLVLQFYNERRKALLSAKPNEAHNSLSRLQEKYSLKIITQNVDNLHEQAGSANVLHLHGELMKSRSTIDPELVYDIRGAELNPGDKCEKGSQLRPHIVWFGEAVPMMDEAIEMASKADIFIVIGTSLVVYPAAGLVDFVPSEARLYVVDPRKPQMHFGREVHYIVEKASVGVPALVDRLLEEV